MRSWWLLLERACALGQLEGPRLANKNIQQGCLSPKKATEQIPEMDQPDSETFWSQCPPHPRGSSHIPLSRMDTPSRQPLCLSGLVVSQGSAQLSLLGLIPAILPRTPGGRLSSTSGAAQGLPSRAHLAPASPQPGHSPSPPWQAEAPEASSLTAKAFWKQVREKV